MLVSSGGIEGAVEGNMPIPPLTSPRRAYRGHTGCFSRVSQGHLLVVLVGVSGGSAGENFMPQQDF
tara:strand:+ start:509 stop:706 length:198 start_codon:yes stop_codon:yes gene_type:complete